MKTSSLQNILAVTVFAVTGAFTAAASAANTTQHVWDCGAERKTVTCALDERSGVFTVTGKGPMKNYRYDTTRPWHDLRNAVTEVTIEDGVTSVGNEAFAFCGNLTSVKLPGSLKSIGVFAFASSDGIDTIHIPSGVTAIGAWAFAFCHGLTSFTLPQNIKKIDVHTFTYCKNLKTVTIPASVTAISDFAFFGTISLESITIPQGVKSIGEEAFASCRELKTITVMPRKPPKLGSDVFDDINKDACLQVPARSMDTYRRAVGWGESFGCIKGTLRRK